MHSLLQCQCQVNVVVVVVVVVLVKSGAVHSCGLLLIAMHSGIVNYDSGKK